VKLAHRLDGPDNAPVVVLVNSLGTTMELWEPQLPALTESHRVLRFDTRGHGASEVPDGPYTVPELADDVVELLDELGLDRVSLCGVSLGGAIGMWLGAAHPERIDRLVLACTSAYFGPPDTWLDRARVARAEGPGALADAVMARWFTERAHAETPEVVARFRDALASTPAEGYAACCEALAEWDFRGRLADVAAPTLVIAAADDPATPPEHGRAIADAILGARMHLIPDAAHLVNVERSDDFDRALLEHLL
jgi:3-oxoadipate enol-lactonase